MRVPSGFTAVVKTPGTQIPSEEEHQITSEVEGCGTFTFQCSMAGAAKRTRVCKPIPVVCCVVCNQ